MKPHQPGPLWQFLATPGFGDSLLLELPDVIEQALPWEFWDLEGLRSIDSIIGAVGLLSEGASIPAPALGTTVAHSRRWLLVSSL